MHLGDTIDSGTELVLGREVVTQERPLGIRIVMRPFLKLEVHNAAHALGHLRPVGARHDSPVGGVHVPFAVDQFAIPRQSGHEVHLAAHVIVGTIRVPADIVSLFQGHVDKGLPVHGRSFRNFGASSCRLLLWPMLWTPGMSAC